MKPGKISITRDTVRRVRFHASLKRRLDAHVREWFSSSESSRFSPLY